MRHADLFAGIGGFRLAAERAGFRCVYACEIDEHARATYADNFDIDHPFSTDIRTAKLPESLDLVTGGFPCQSYSYARNRPEGGSPPGLDDPRGDLFWDLARRIEEARPRMFLLENVASLATHRNHRFALRSILERLRGMGYGVSISIVDGGEWVPQRRKRLFFAGKRGARDDWMDFRLAAPGRDRQHLKDVLLPESAIPDKAYISEKAIEGNGRRYGVPKTEARGWTWVALDRLGHTPTVTRSNNAGRGTLFTARGPRRLVPRELARLFGVPDSFRLPESWTKCDDQLGNMVVVPAVAAVLEAMKRCA